MGRKTIDTMSLVQFVSQNRWFPKLQKTKYPSPQSYCFWHIHAQTLRLAHSSYIALKLKSLWETEEIEFIWELISYSLIGVSDTWPGTVKLFFPSYKVLSNLSLHFALAPCPVLTVPYSQHPERSLLSRLFALAYAIPIGKPLSFIVCLAHFLRCSSGVWEAVCDHCLHWSGVWCASKASCIYFAMMLNKPPCCSHLSLPPHGGLLERRSLSSSVCVPSAWQLIEAVMKTNIFWSISFISGKFQAFYLLIS